VVVELVVVDEVPVVDDVPPAAVAVVEPLVMRAAVVMSVEVP